VLKNQNFKKWSKLREKSKIIAGFHVKNYVVRCFWLALPVDSR